MLLALCCLTWPALVAAVGVSVKGLLDANKNAVVEGLETGNEIKVGKGPYIWWNGRQKGEPYEATVGDVITFRFNSDNNVWLMGDNETYRACDFSTATMVASQWENNAEGNYAAVGLVNIYRAVLLSEGMLYFSCRRPLNGHCEHCEFGQKMKVRVSKFRPPRPPPSPPPLTCDRATNCVCECCTADKCPDWPAGDFTMLTFRAPSPSGCNEQACREHFPIECPGPGPGRITARYDDSRMCPPPPPCGSPDCACSCCTSDACLAAGDGLFRTAGDEAACSTEECARRFYECPGWPAVQHAGNHNTATKLDVQPCTPPAPSRPYGADDCECLCCGGESDGAAECPALTSRSFMAGSPVECTADACSHRFSVCPAKGTPNAQVHHKFAAAAPGRPPPSPPFPPPPFPPPSPPPSSGDETRAAIIGGVIGGAFGLVCCAVVCVAIAVLIRREKQGKPIFVPITPGVAAPLPSTPGATSYELKEVSSSKGAGRTDA